MIPNINVRFFVDAVTKDGSDIDTVEITEPQFLTFSGSIRYERHTVFANGCHQICLTAEPFDAPYIEDLDVIDGGS